MRIERLRLSNFRGFEELDLEFPNHGTTVLVGINGAGKTSILEAIGSLLQQFIGAHEWSGVIGERLSYELGVALDDRSYARDLDEALNLNSKVLVRARKQVIDALIHALQAKLGVCRYWKAADIDTWLRRWRARQDDRFLAFAQLGVFLLAKWRRAD